MTYIEPDGTKHVYSASGDNDTIEILMPNTQQLDVEFAKDSIEGLGYRNVIVGMFSENGILIVPEETMPLVVEYDYMLSVNNGNIHAVLDKDVVHNISTLEGEVILNVHPATNEDLNKNQIDAIGDNYAVSVSLQVSGNYVSQLGGTAEISVKTDRDDVKVYYVDPSGALEFIESVYDGGDTIIDVSHFSIYMYEVPGGGKSDIPPIAIMFTSVIIMFLPLEILRWREKKE